MTTLNFTEDILCLLTPQQLDKLKEMYLTPGVVKLFQEPQMLDFCVGFFKHGLNASAAAKKMFMHRNTLNYRLKKIEKATGLDLKKFEDAFIFKILLNLYSNRAE